MFFFFFVCAWEEDYKVFKLFCNMFSLSLSLSVFNLVSLGGLGEDHKAFNFGAGVADSNG